MMAIVDIVGRRVLVEARQPLVECDVRLVVLKIHGPRVPLCHRAVHQQPREAIELRDGDKSRYLGKGMLKARGAHQHRDHRGRAGPGRVRSRPSSTRR